MTEKPQVRGYRWWQWVPAVVLVIPLIPMLVAVIAPNTRSVLTPLRIWLGYAGLIVVTMVISAVASDGEQDSSPTQGQASPPPQAGEPTAPASTQDAGLAPASADSQPSDSCDTDSVRDYDDRMAKVTERYMRHLNKALDMHSERYENLSLMADRKWMAELQEHVTEFRTAANDVRQTVPPPVMEPAHDLAIGVSNVLDDLARMIGSDDTAYIMGNEPVLEAKIVQFVEQATRMAQKVREICGLEGQASPPPQATEPTSPTPTPVAELPPVSADSQPSDSCDTDSVRDYTDRMAKIAERISPLFDKAFDMHYERYENLSLMADPKWMAELQAHVDELSTAANDIRQTVPPPVMEPAHDLAIGASNLLDSLARMIGDDDPAYIMGNQGILSVITLEFVAQTNRAAQKVREICGREDQASSPPRAEEPTSPASTPVAELPPVSADSQPSDSCDTDSVRDYTDRMAKIAERISHHFDKAFDMHYERYENLSLMADPKWMAELQAHVDELSTAANDIRKTVPPPVMEPAHDLAIGVSNLLEDLARMIGADDPAYIMGNQRILSAITHQFAAQTNRAAQKVREICGLD